MASGDTLELKIISEKLGSKTFAVKGGEDVTHDLGGYTSELLINGNGTGHKKLTTKPWMIEGLQLDTTNEGSIEFLQSIADNAETDTFVWSGISGDVYKGKGTLTGDLKASKTEGYTTVTLSGVGRLEKIG